MNSRQIAIDVFKHPLIQEILKRKLAESSIINRLIVEEISEERRAELDKRIEAEIEFMKKQKDVYKHLNDRFKALQGEYTVEDEFDGIWSSMLDSSGLDDGQQTSLVNRINQRKKTQARKSQAKKQPVQANDACAHFEKIWAEIKQNPDYQRIKNEAIKGTDIDPNKLENEIRSYSQNVSLALDLAALGAIALVFIVGSTTIGGFAMAPIIGGLLLAGAATSLIACIIGVKQKDASIETGGDCIASIPILGRIAKFFGYGAKAAKLAKGAATATKAAEKTADAGGFIGRLQKMQAGAEAAVKAADKAFLKKMADLGMNAERAAALLTITKRLTKEATKKAASEAKESFMKDGKLDEQAYNEYKKKLEECRNNASISNSADIVSTEVEEFKKEVEEISNAEVDKKELEANLQKATIEAEGEEEKGFFSKILSKITGGDKEIKPVSEGPFLDSLDEGDTKDAFRKFIKKIKNVDSNYLLETEKSTGPVDDWLKKFAHETIPRIFREELEPNEQQLIIEALRDPNTLEQFLALFKPEALSSEEEEITIPPEETTGVDGDGDADEEETTDGDGDGDADEEETTGAPEEEEEELPPSSPVSEEKKKEFMKAKNGFIKWFLTVPFLQDQQLLLVNLLDALDFTKGEKARIGKPEGETGSPPEEKVDEILTEENQVAPLRTSLRRVDNTLRTLNGSLKFYLYGGRSTKKGSSRYKNEIVESIKELQELIERSYNYLSDFTPTMTEEDADYSKDEDAINAVEQAYEEARVALGDITTALESGENVGQVVALASVVQDILKPILIYYPKTANFTETATMSARDAFEELQEVITLFHSRTLVPLYIQLKDDTLTSADITKGKNGLVYLATRLEKLLGVSNPISDAETEVDPSTPPITSSRTIVPGSGEHDEFEEEVEETEETEEKEGPSAEPSEPMEETIYSELINITKWLQQEKAASPDDVEEFYDNLWDFIGEANLREWYQKIPVRGGSPEWREIKGIEHVKSSRSPNMETVIKIELDDGRTRMYDFGSSIAGPGGKFLDNVGQIVGDRVFPLKNLPALYKPKEEIEEQIIKKLKPIIEQMLGGYNG